MTAWYFLTFYYYAVVAGPFADQAQCEQMRKAAYDAWVSKMSVCYQAPLVVPVQPPVDFTCGKTCSQK